jgi:hypothetical protein
MKLGTMILTVGMALGLNSLAQTQTKYNPQALQEVILRVEEAKAHSRTPVVLFDLDDTLINTRERNMRIIKDFAAQADIQANFAKESTIMEEVKLKDIKYQLSDTLSGIGIQSVDLMKQASDFWLSRFFGNEYCAQDIPTPGAAKYLHFLARAGAQIVYLTGRDIPRMQEGTIINLKRNFFPASAKLMMKPDPKMDDLLFKKQAFADVAAMGEVVGVFENEPANVNAMSEAFPKATAIFLDTIHSAKPDVPAANVQWVKDFTGR